MLNFYDTTLVKLQIKEEMREKLKYDVEKMKFYNSRYNKHDLSSYIVVNKKPRKSKLLKKDDE